MEAQPLSREEEARLAELNLRHRELVKEQTDAAAALKKVNREWGALGMRKKEWTPGDQARYEQLTAERRPLLSLTSKLRQKITRSEEERLPLARRVRTVKEELYGQYTLNQLMRELLDEFDGLCLRLPGEIKAKLQIRSMLSQIGAIAARERALAVQAEARKIDSQDAA